MPEELVAGSPSAKSPYPQLLSLGMVIAERRVVLRESDGRERQVLVRLGLPVQALPYLYRCPAEIIGLGMDGKILAPAGLDAIEALHYALDLVGKMLNLRAEELGLASGCEGFDPTTMPWIWKFPAAD